VEQQTQVVVLAVLMGIVLVAVTVMLAMAVVEL
jgi:hypothetical protein